MGLDDAEKFWKLTENDIDGTFTQIKAVSSLGGSFYSTVYMKINKSKYRLKRACGKYFSKLVYERKVIKNLPDLYLTPPLIIAYAINEQTEECFLLFKYPPGFIVLKNLLEYNLHPTIIADFEVRKKDVMKKLSKAIHKMEYSDYYYPYWYSDHILVKNQSDEIALIDLEDFLPLKKCPWYYRLEAFSWYIRKKQWRTLRKSLASDVFTQKYMRSLIN